jgi:predicted RNA-binding protein with RPS1 domain
MGGSEVTFHQWGIAAGAVLNHHPFGFFADRGDAVIGLVEIIRVKEPGQPVDARDCPPVGQEITAAVLGAVDLQRRVHLSIRPSDRKAANGPPAPAPQR